MTPRRTWHTCQPMDLHRMAREYFLAAKRIELQRLARDLGISRATAYRWAGSAEQLVGEVVASLFDDAIDALLDAADDLTGVERVAFVAEGLLTEARELTALNRYLKQNPRQGLKVLCSDESVVRARTSARLEAILSSEMAAGNLKNRGAPDFVAATLTRMLEPFLYTDAIVGNTAETGDLGDIVRFALETN